MICPECSSRDSIIWDYKNGTLVCTACGLVVDRLYDFDCYKIEANDKNGYNAKGNIMYREKIKETSKHLRRCKNTVNEYYRILKHFNLRPGVRVKDEVLRDIALGKKIKLVKTLVRGNTIELSNVLKGNELEQAKIILDVLNEYPRIASRTDRVKQALSILILYKIKNVNVSYSEIARKFHVDPVNLMRAYKILKTKYYKDFVEDIKVRIPNINSILL